VLLSETEADYLAILTKWCTVVKPNVVNQIWLRQPNINQLTNNYIVITTKFQLN